MIGQCRSESALLFKAPRVPGELMAPKGNVKFIDWIVNKRNVATWLVVKPWYDRFIAWLIDLMTYP